MNPLDRQIAQRLTQYYVLALLLVALLTVSELFFVKKTLRGLNDDGRVVNVAGRQRMLSQRLTKLALLRTRQISHSDRGDFSRLKDQWYARHKQLKAGLLRMEKEYVVRKSVGLDSMFVALEAIFDPMYDNLAIIDSDAATAAQKSAALAVVLRQEPAFLKQMEAIVFRFDAESLARVQYLERIEWVLTLVTLTVLFLEGIFVFRPVVGRTRQVVRRLTESEEALRKANVALKVANTQLLATQQKLVRTMAEKYELQLAEETVRSAALLEGQEEERKRFARELHDGIGQMLTGLKLHVEKLKKIPFANQKQQQQFADLRSLLQETIHTTRAISFNLMPSVLSDFGLEAALQLLSDQTARSSGLAIHYFGSRGSERLTPAQEIGLYRIAQEAINNAIKHAEASHIDLNFEQNEHEIVLQVVDDGKGFKLAPVPVEEPPFDNHSGIANMRTRARMLNGSLMIQSGQHEGSKIEVKIESYLTLSH